MNASATSGLCAFLLAEPRMSADQYEIVFSFAVAGRSSPVGRIGAAAPIALTGAIKICSVAIAIIEPAAICVHLENDRGGFVAFGHFHRAPQKRQEGRRDFSA